MPKRKLNSYLLLSRSGRANMRYSNMAQKSAERKPLPYLMYQLKDFLANNFLAWFVHSWHISPRYPYPASVTGCIYSLNHPDDPGAPVSLCLAADWANSTPQSEFIGNCIDRLDPDYTLHLGDTYYTGNVQELKDNFGEGNGIDYGIWPRGKAGSFALAGNHEMFSSGAYFLQMIKNRGRGFGERLFHTNQYRGQQAPFFCLRTDHWCILGLDTGYDSLYQPWLKRIFDTDPNNTELKFPDALIRWLREEVHIEEDKRGIVLLTHHQYISAFSGEEEFQNPAIQLRELLGPDREIIWIWGHEHRFSMYKKYRASQRHIIAWGRCIGNGGMPDEHISKRVINPQKAIALGLELYDNRVADTFHFDIHSPLDIGYNGYASISIDRDKLSITYWAAYWNGKKQSLPHNQKLITEDWIANNRTGQISCILQTDNSIDPATGKSALNRP